ncbi:MAG: hypothetical protein HY678_06865 [Chloroflexi bacterium]|nr:hypothetical protein [Chloroflexota bacterium]
MTDSTNLDRTFHAIITRLVETGRASHYTELATDLGCGVEESRRALHDLMATSYPAWLHPDSDLIAVFQPFSSIPTQYKITVDGHQKWFSQ